MAGGQIGHVPVLPSAVFDLLAVKSGETVVDVTIGLAGHAAALCQASGPDGTLVGLDVDPASLDAARERLACVPCRVRLVKANFQDVPAVLAAEGVGQADVLFADLGVNSMQLADARRGLTFQEDGPLDMRLDPELEVTAADLVNRLKERELSDLLYYNTQEMRSRRIAKRICEARREGRITSTGRLVEVVCTALGVADPTSRRWKIHPATRTFLALRMAVNQETKCLAALLDVAPGLLRPGGRIGIITFHSVEDRAVKLDFRQRTTEGTYRLLTKKPVVADEEERLRNPRSRSAKLRVAVRCD